MANEEKSFGADLPVELVDKFTGQIEERGFLKKRAIVAAFRLWIELPREVQARLIDLKLDGSSLREMVQKIVQDMDRKKK